jgi:hypothetical protein
MIRAGYVGEPGTPDHVVLYFPCVGCWEEKMLVGAIVGEDHQTLIHVEKGEEERSSRAYYCAACWTRDVEPRIEGPEGPAMVSHAEGLA